MAKAAKYKKMKIHCINIDCAISLKVDIDVQIFEMDIFDVFIELIRF